MQFGAWAPFFLVPQGAGTRPGDTKRVGSAGIPPASATWGAPPYFWGRPGGVSLVKMSLFFPM